MIRITRVTRVTRIILAAPPALLALATLAPVTAEARQGGGTVTACSRYGNGCITVPVRPGRFGPEMRLKGGTWIDCRGSCKDTLREETVDFWETLRERTGGNGRR
jgi:hypothetical protein